MIAGHMARSPAWVHRPLPQDAALACGLLLTCLLANDPSGMVRTVAGHPFAVGWGGPSLVWSWWAATAVAVAGVALRRRLPIPMLLACTLATGVHLASGTLPTVVDLAVPICVCTVAARRRTAVSLAALATPLLVLAGWSCYGTLADRPLPGLSFRQVSYVTKVRDDAGHLDVTRHDGGANAWGGLFLFGSILTAAWAVGVGAGSRRAYLDELGARARDLERERDQQAALAVAAERGRISREMHDVVAHGLSMIVIQAQGADAALDQRPADARRALAEIVKAGRDSLADMRRALSALGEVEDTWHPQPGLAQLPALLSRVRQAGTPVRLRVEGAPAALPATVDLSAYRIVQEALTNVMKHAGPGTRADVLVTYRRTDVGIEVVDDGPGGDGSGGGGSGGDRRADAGTGARPEGGSGLRGMHDRVRLLGGRLTAGTGDRTGFAVRAVLPIEGREA